LVYPLANRAGAAGRARDRTKPVVRSGHLVYRGFAAGMKHGQAEPDGIAPPDPAWASRTEAKVN